MGINGNTVVPCTSSLYLSRMSCMAGYVLAWYYWGYRKGARIPAKPRYGRRSRGARVARQPADRSSSKPPLRLKILPLKRERRDPRH